MVLHPKISIKTKLPVKPPRGKPRGILIRMAELSIAISPPFHPP